MHRPRQPLRLLLCILHHGRSRKRAGRAPAPPLAAATAERGGPPPPAAGRLQLATPIESMGSGPAGPGAHPWGFCVETLLRPGRCTPGLEPLPVNCRLVVDAGAPALAWRPLATGTMQSRAAGASNPAAVAEHRAEIQWCKKCVDAVQNIQGLASASCRASCLPAPACWSACAICAHPAAPQPARHPNAVVQQDLDAMLLPKQHAWPGAE